MEVNESSLPFALVLSLGWHADITFRDVILLCKTQRTEDRLSLHIVVKRVPNRTERFHCVFGSKDGLLNVRRVLRMWLCAHLLSP
jgi:hypothetical protein